MGFKVIKPYSIPFDMPRLYVILRLNKVWNFKKNAEDIEMNQKATLCGALFKLEGHERVLSRKLSQRRKKEFYYLNLSQEFLVCSQIISIGITMLCSTITDTQTKGLIIFYQIRHVSISRKIFETQQILISRFSLSL